MQLDVFDKVELSFGTHDKFSFLRKTLGSLSSLFGIAFNFTELVKDEYPPLAFFVNPIRCVRALEPLRVWTFFYFLARKKFYPL
ncbi:hypothetical protein LEP1GSC062_0838 [Leptospira alexanderi serovar Manhao 3 str. L 60]|uniref:Uncharacterized protein n=1 Tax=Leptospira alexanderi serovar Manhao 3 str. L 60 TaxID=1049759 RepID=V6IFV3_9LEPT|nr:hypothetical protein LEP1GSC062_0838 [Leptospira alexanderi serovar Manhao 3 str. L 60]